MRDLYVVESELGSLAMATMSLRERDFSVLAPQYIAVRVVRGQKIEVVRPVFLNYLFVELNLLDVVSNRWRAIRRLRGVRQLFMGASELPVALPKHETRRLLATYARPVPLQKVLPYLRAGTQVKVTTTGMPGTVIDHDDDEGVKLLVWVFNRALEVLVKREHVELAS